MSQENVEAVRHAFDCWNRGDREGWLASAHPDAEFSSAILRQLEGAGAVHQGRAAVARYWDEWHATWSALRIEVTDIRDLDDVVVALTRLRARGTASGAEVDRPFGWVFRFENGLIRHAWAYLSPEEALQAAGLSE
jgi:ketosteroid isomerase-like protein